jgi:hypothetical protein
VLTGTELARLNTGEYVLGTYEEVERYAEEQNACVDQYLNYVNPSTVTSKFKYVGTGVNPYAVAKAYYLKDEEGKFAIGITEFKEKF